MVQSNYRLLWEERVDHKTSHQVDCENYNRPMPGVFDLRHIIQSILYSLNQHLLAIVLWPKNCSTLEHFCIHPSL